MFNLDDIANENNKITIKKGHIFQIIRTEC